MAVLPAITPDNTTDFLALGGLLSVLFILWFYGGVGKQLIQFLFVRMVIDKVIQFSPSLHGGNHISLRAFRAYCPVHIQCGRTHCAKGGKRIKRHGDVSLGQLIDCKQRRYAKLGHICQNRHFYRCGKLPVRFQLGYRFGKDHVRARLHIGA